MLFKKAPTLPVEQSLAPFHPSTPVCDFGDGFVYTISDATVGTGVWGATGGGKTSSMRRLAKGFLRSSFGGIILCAKKDEARTWIKLAQECDRASDVRIVDASAGNRLNFLEWEALQEGAGGGLVINVVALLEELITALHPKGKGGIEDGSFWEDALHLLLTKLVEIVHLANYPLSLQLMLSVLRSAPVNRATAHSDEWKARANDEEDTNWCWKLLCIAQERTTSLPEERFDYEECRAYWLDDFANLSERTRSIIVLMFTKLAQPFTARPLRNLFSSDKPTVLKPEDTFDGKLIIIDLPTQEFRLAGRIAALIWKYCWQVAVMRREPPPAGEYLRPVFCWADEAAENFLSRSDSAFQAVARSVAGCTVYLAQNINQYRRVLGSDDAFESFVSNLQNKFFCANTGHTNSWASKTVFGERWITVLTRNYTPAEFESDPNIETMLAATRSRNDLDVKEHHRPYLEPSAFATLKRGGPMYDNTVEVIAFKNGQLFAGPQPRFGFSVQPGNRPEMVPYKLLTIRQGE